MVTGPQGTFGGVLPFDRLKAQQRKAYSLDEEALDAFCHQLVDYLSAGHFHVYDRIVPEGETTSALIYSALQENTQQIMALYDSHLESAIDHDNYLAFQEALSGVGEALANRFILEDKLIQQALEYSVQAASALPAANSADMARPA
ncbi:Regulator of sigma D [Sodalis praecaptivus]